jgi:hypothetical protein
LEAVIFTRPKFDRAYRSLPAQQQAAVKAAIARVEPVFGRPHLHSGIGLRPFGKYFEFRAGLDLRILFCRKVATCICVSWETTTKSALTSKTNERPFVKVTVRIWKPLPECYCVGRPAADANETKAFVLIAKEPRLGWFRLNTAKSSCCTDGSLAAAWPARGAIERLKHIEW